MDTRQGEPYYDPFAFDVGCMGNMLSKYNVNEFSFTCVGSFSEYTYQYLTPDVPFLAPLLDRMTMHIVSRRFTAVEAHEFCKAIKQRLTQEELERSLRPKPAQIQAHYVDRWGELPPDFVKAWSPHRERPPSLVIRFLRWIGSSRLGWNLLCNVRRSLGI